MLLFLMLLTLRAVQHFIGRNVKNYPATGWFVFPVSSDP